MDSFNSPAFEYCCNRHTTNYLVIMTKLMTIRLSWYNISFHHDCVMYSLLLLARVSQLLSMACLRCSIVSMPTRSRSFAVEGISCTALSSRFT